MKYYIIASRSMTYAQRMIKALEKAGIPASLKRDTAGSGCVYSVKTRHIEAVRVLREAGFDVSAVREEGQ